MVKLTGQELEQAKKERADFVTLQRDRLVKIDQAMKIMQDIRAGPESGYETSAWGGQIDL